MTFNTAKPNTKKGNTIESVIKSPSLKGVEYLRAVEFTTTYSGKKVVGQESKTLCWTLKVATPDEVKDYRKKGTPGFVLKDGDQLYLTEIPKNFSFVNSNISNRHMCAYGQTVCHRLSPLSDEQGGCAKVRNYATFIEDYPFITRGYETFNTKHDVLVVNQCKNSVISSSSRDSKSTGDMNRIKVNIAQLYYPNENIKNIHDVKKKKMENRKRNSIR